MEDERKALSLLTNAITLDKDRININTIFKNITSNDLWIKILKAEKELGGEAKVRQAYTYFRSSQSFELTNSS